MHDYTVEIARAMIEMCAAPGSPVRLAYSCTSRHAVAVEVAIARDLRKLAMMALPFGIRVAFEGLAWGRRKRVALSWKTGRKRLLVGGENRP